MDTGLAPDRHRSRRAAPPQLRDAGADALHHGDGREVRYRRLRPVPHQDARGGRLERLPGAQGRGREARQALRPRARLLCRVDQRHGHERDGPLRGEGRRQGRDLDGHAGHGAGAADQLHPARLGAARHRCLADRDRDGRFRQGGRRRLDGLALGLYRRLGGAERQREAGRQGQGAGGRRARGGARPTSSMPAAASPSPAPTAASASASWRPSSRTSASSSRT